MRRPGVSPAAFAEWAARLSSRLAAIGAPLRLSVLNEPDLNLAAGDSCDPVAAARVVRQAGYVAVKRRVRVKVRRTRLARRVVRSGGRRRVIRKKLVWRVHRWRTVTRLQPAGSAHVTSTVSVARGCLAVRRARRAVVYLDAAIPAVRAAAPGVEVGAGETSPCPGVDVFIHEVARLGIPSIDRWAHHPYVLTSGGREVPSTADWMGSDRLVAFSRTIRGLFGPGLRIDLTEFGIKHSEVPDPEIRASMWRATYARACAAQSRSLVVYQWTPTPPGQGRIWDTSILGEGLTPTPVSAQLPLLRC